MKLGWGGVVKLDEAGWFAVSEAASRGDGLGDGQGLAAGLPQAFNTIHVPGPDCGTHDGVERFQGGCGFQRAVKL